MYPSESTYPAPLLLPPSFHRFPPNPLFLWVPKSTWIPPVSFTPFPCHSLSLLECCPIVAVWYASTVRPPSVWPWEPPPAPLVATTVSSTNPFPRTLAPMHRLWGSAVETPTAPPYPDFSQCIWPLSVFHLTSKPLRPPVSPSSYLWLSAPSSPLSSLLILYGLPPPSSSSPPTWTTTLIQTTEPLAPHLNKTLLTHGYLSSWVKLSLLDVPKTSASSWCSGKSMASFRWTGPGVLLYNWNVSPLPTVHIPLYPVYWSLSTMIYGLTPHPYVAAVSMLLGISWQYIYYSPSWPLSYEFLSYCTTAMVLGPPTLYLPWTYSACAWSVHGSWPGCAAFPVTPPPGMPPTFHF